MVKAKIALLPGDFIDPIGQVNLLDISVLSDKAREFVLNKLNVEKMTIQSYVKTALSKFFENTNSLDLQQYKCLIEELSSHSELIDDESTRTLLGSLRLSPTQDGGWSQPTNTYHRSEDLVKVLGDTKRLWLDENRLPDKRSVHNFMNNLGIRRSATARHLVDRILDIADESSPTDDAKRASGEAFYVLCENYDQWKSDEAFREILDDLASNACLPAQNDSENWYAPSDLYAPYRSEAFHSQVYVLDFRNTVRLDKDLLEKLNISTTPDTEIVINHLKQCMEQGSEPHTFTYQILNERAKESDPLVAKLKGSQCIYVENQGKFVRTNQVYKIPPQLGRHAFAIHRRWYPFAPLLEAIGIKDEPECSDYVTILLDIVEEHSKRSMPVVDDDFSIYVKCLGKIATAHDQQKCDVTDIQRLQEYPTILNLEGLGKHPDEILLRDSEWYTNFFKGELDQVLCKLPVEFHQLAMELGVRMLSESANISLEDISGDAKGETALAQNLMERAGIFVRLLDDKPTYERKQFHEAISAIDAVSYDDVYIKASVRVGENTKSAPSHPVSAFYDIKQDQLICRRPVLDYGWPHILNAIFHPLMPQATESEILKLTALGGLLMNMTIKEAHDYLTKTGMPPHDDDHLPRDKADLVSPELGRPGAGGGNTEESISPGSNRGKGVGISHPESSGKQNQATQNRKPYRRAEQSLEYLQKTHERKSDQSNEQWDRRLLSYVRPKQEKGRKGGEDHSEHNLALESIARDAVCLYEKKRGRIAELMPQKHPGYDIISRDSLTGEERRIEIKSVSRQWNLRGVGLSSVQFSNAQEYGDSYWLYVVEFASDPARRQIHLIQNPAEQVTSFMFDGGWRDAVTDESPDPARQFVPGRRIRHESMGDGEIRKVDVRGSTRVLTIRLHGQEQDTHNVVLNLNLMRILQDEDGDDNP